MRKLILRLAGSETIRKIVKFVRLHTLANGWLHCFPVINILSRSGIRYRARRVESLGLSVEMFDRQNLYSVADLPSDIRSFADVGCNVGYFTCWLCGRMNNRQLSGLMVDANAAAIREAQWHIDANKFSNIYALHGLAGGKSKEGFADFFLHVANVCSTATPPSDAKLERRDTWRRIQVPCVDFNRNWCFRFDDMHCDLLKVDIEGAEMDFFRNEIQFLQRTKAILCEWHKWRVSLQEVESFLSGQGFKLKRILQENAQLGTALFVREN